MCVESSTPAYVLIMESVSGGLKCENQDHCGSPVADFSVLGRLVQRGVGPAHALPLTFPTEPYTVREARIHVRHVRDLLKSLDPSDAFNGVDCNSLSFLSVFTDGDLGGAGGIGAGGWAGVQGQIGRGLVKGPGARPCHQEGAGLEASMWGPVCLRVALC